MKFIKTSLKDLYIIEFEPIQDERGRFYRVFCKDEFKQIDHHGEIVQINHSLSKKKGTIRGMHFQYPPKSEIKMVKCLQGSVYDVAIDIRKNSSTFLKWHGEILSAENLKMMYIPEGFAHGFQTLEENTELLYFHTEFYDAEHEGGIRFDDPLISLQWPLDVSTVSKRDKEHKLLSNHFKGVEI
ncbi:MAG: dTDP-4-dehydrorhamnose 3,5-epimerase [Promethearchaeota archaeon]